MSRRSEFWNGFAGVARNIKEVFSPFDWNIFGGGMFIVGVVLMFFGFMMVISAVLGG